MNTTDRPQGRTSRVKPDLFIGQGGVRQHGGSLPLYRCNACGADVVWAESRRTGRKYLVTVSRSYHSDARFYIGANVHTEQVCNERVDWARRQDRDATRAAWQRQGLCIDCGDEATFDSRIDEKSLRCMDCVMDARREAEAAWAVVQETGELPS